MATEKSGTDTIVCAAVEIASAQERASFIAKACGDDRDLQGRVERLVAAHFDAGSFLQKPAARGADATPLATVDEPISERPGTVIGPYKLLQQIGEGGMGTVFMAEQTHPVHRKVALKVIKPGMDSGQVIARFEAERQALAMMDHVNIARVLDAGATELGRPYFVMELVHGVPITKYCDDNRLSPRERLELFVPVCQAIQHAHQKGIIHRDIKPSNVMITLYDGKPVPKVIDFGVAKATEQKLTERTLFTQYGTMVGTFEYMSPEQAEMSALGVDTRSDIFSLGVLLYELLTGSTPLSHKRLKEAALGEILRLIKEEEPPKPSTRLSDSGEALASISANRHMEPAKLSKLVRGELDWIVMKSLEKDRSRRYETASGLGRDVQRYLADETVEACPPSVGYKLRKFARKNRKLLATMGAFAVLLIAGTAISTWQWREADAQSRLATRKSIEAEDNARQASDNAARAEKNSRLAKAKAREAHEAVNKWYLLVSEGPLLEAPGLETVRKKLLETAREYYESFLKQTGDDPELQADLAAVHLRLGTIYVFLRRPDALAHLFKGLEIVERLARERPDDREYAKRVGGFLRVRGFRVNGIELPLDFEQVLPMLQRTSSLWEKFARDNPEIPGLQSDLIVQYALTGEILAERNQPDQALLAFRKGIEIADKLGPEHLQAADCAEALLHVYNTTGRLLGAMGKTTEKEQLLTKAVDRAEKLVADFPGDVRYGALLAICYSGKATFLQDTDRQPEAEKIYRQAIAQLDKALAASPGNADYGEYLAETYRHLGACLDRMKRAQEAEKALRQAVTISEKLLADFPQRDSFQNLLAASHRRLGQMLQDSGRDQEAKEELRKAEELEKRLAGKHLGLAKEGLKLEPKNEEAMKALGMAYFKAGNWEGVIELYEKIPAPHLAFWPAMAHWRLGHKDVARLLYYMAVAHDERHPEYQKTFRGPRRDTAKLLGLPDSVERSDKALAYLNQGNAYQQQGQTEKAKEAYGKAIDIYAELATDLPGVPVYSGKLIELLTRTGRAQEAERVYRQIIDTIVGFEKLAADSSYQKNYRWFAAFAYWQLIDPLVSVNRLQEAEGAIRQSLAVLEKQANDMPAHDLTRAELAVNHRRLGDLLQKTNRPQEAEQAYGKALALQEQLLAGAPTARERERIAKSRQALAQLYAGRGQWDKAVAEYTKALELDPKNSNSLVGRGSAYARLQQKDKAAADIRKAIELGPQDANAHNIFIWNLVRYEDSPNPDPAWAVEVMKKAAAKDPLAGIIWNTLGVAQYRAGDWNQTIETLHKSMELRGDVSVDGFFLAMAHWQQGEKERAGKWFAAADLHLQKYASKNEEHRRWRSEAVALLDVRNEPAKTPTGTPQDDLDIRTLVLEAHPEAPWAHAHRGGVHAVLNHWDEASADLAKAIELKHEQAHSWYTHALIQLARKDQDGYRKACARMLARFGPSPNLDAADWTAWTCALAPDAVSDWAPVVRLAEKPVTADPKSFDKLNHFGAVLYRAGRFEDAAKRLTEAETVFKQSKGLRSSPVYNWLFLAMTEHRLGHAAEAQTWLAKAVQEIDRPTPEKTQAAPIPWNRRLTLQLLRREAEELLKKESGVRGQESEKKESGVRPESSG